MKSKNLLIFLGCFILVSCSSNKSPVITAQETSRVTNTPPATATTTPTKKPTDTVRPSQTKTPTKTPYPLPYGGGTGVFLISKNKELSIYDSNDGTSKHLMDSVDKYAWSPDGSKIAALTSGGSDPGGLYVINAADGSKKLVEKRAGILRIAWSPKGSTLAYLVPSHPTLTFKKDLIFYNPNNSTSLILNTEYDNTGYSSPHGIQISVWDFGFTPDGSAVYLSAIYGGGHSSYIYRIRGMQWNTLPVRVTNQIEGSMDSLKWSPDGTRMTVSKCEEGNIYLFETGKFDLEKMTDFPAGETAQVCLMTLEWFHDSQGIVFFRNGSIYRVDKDGANLKKLIGNPTGGFYESPTISPDGKLIAYSSSTSEGKEIYLMDLNGENAFKLTDGDSAAWQLGIP